MKIKINILIILFFIIAGCSSLKEAGKIIRNEKVKTTDEFLVKKRNPLVLPPNFEIVPVPGSISENKQNQEDKLKEILKASEIDNTNNESSSVEESILNRIRK